MSAQGDAAIERAYSVTCGACGGELDGTWTCPNDCLDPLTDAEIEAMRTYQVTRELMLPRRERGDAR